jgi:hypothetical protein
MKKSLRANILFLFALSVIYLPNKVAAQNINTYAGHGVVGFTGDGGQATAATMNEPEGVAVDAAGNLYIGDETNNRVRKVNTSGIISTYAGNGVAGYSGDGGQATAAAINAIDGLRLDAAGNLYIADNGNNRIRKINTNGIITTWAGNGVGGFSGDGGQATAAEIDFPTDVAADGAGNVYIADYFNDRIRKVTPAGVISTFAGTGGGGFSGDGGQATAAQISGPYGVRADATGKIYIADYTNNRVRVVNSSGVISTIVGNGTGGFSGDGGQATAAEIAGPVGMAWDAAGNMYVDDYQNSRIRKVTPAGIISTFAGNGVGSYCCDGGPATAGEMAEPIDVTMSSSGCLYIADWINERVRVVCTVVLPIQLLSFDATYEQVNNTVALNWVTATETNNKSFTIEKQTGGDDWQTVVTMTGAGNSSQTHYYTTTDENPTVGISYYRIMQTDYDGNYTYSDVKTVNVPNSYFVNIYPNPVRDNLNVDYNSMGTGDISIRVISISGSEAMPAYIVTNIQTGKNAIPINTSLLGSGMYILEVTNQVQTYYKKFIKL